MIKPIVRLESARADELDIVAHYAREGGLELAFRFAKALREAYRLIGDRPAMGSPRYGDLLGIEGLRSRSLKRFPFVIFYVERADHIDIWRVLHAQRDIAAWLRGGNTD